MDFTPRPDGKYDGESHLSDSAFEIMIGQEHGKVKTKQRGIRCVYGNSIRVNR